MNDSRPVTDVQGPREPTDRSRQAPDVPGLLLHHFDELHYGSGLSVEVIREQHYRSVWGAHDLARYGFSDKQLRGFPALVLPVHAPDGSNGLAAIKPDKPRTERKPDGSERTIKYEWPAGTRLRLDVPVRCVPLLADPNIALGFTEGNKKAAAAAQHGLCVVSLNGVWGWRDKVTSGPLADFDRIPLAGRHVFLCFDSDVMVKPDVEKALAAFREFLESRDAIVSLVYLPTGDDGAKVGLDDYLLTHTAGDFRALIGKSYCLVSRGESIRQDNIKLSPGRLPFAPISQALADAADAVDPVVAGIAYPGALTGMSAREKIGKSTLMFALFKALENGSPFLGLPTRKAGVVLLTEENADTIGEKQEQWGIGDHVHVLYRHQAEGTPFKEIMAQARDYALEHDLAGIVVDTFFEWSDLAGEEENQSGSVKAAVQAAKAVVADGKLFVFLICHDSKGGPWRGSTVLPAMLDVKLELRVPAGEDADTTNRRILTGKGRYAGIPRALLCELDDNGYRAIGEPAPRERVERNRVVTAVAQLGETKWEPVAQKLGLSKPQTLALLRAAVRAGDLSCLGRGVRNDPMVFRAIAPPGSGPDGFVLSCLAPLGDEPTKTSLDAAGTPTPAQKVPPGDGIDLIPTPGTGGEYNRTAATELPKTPPPGTACEHCAETGGVTLATTRVNGRWLCADDAEIEADDAEVF